MRLREEEKRLAKREDKKEGEEAHPNSVTFIANARKPGKIIAIIVCSVVPRLPKNCSCPKTFPHPSKMMLHVARVTPIIGASQNSVAIGLPIPMLSLSSNIWVRDLKPPSAEAVRTSTMPTRWNWVSVETMRMTPEVMIRMIPARRQEGTSRWKRKAKRRTKAREEDLHMAVHREKSRWVHRSGKEEKKETNCRRRE
jgi:hypothetical protein